MKKVVGLVTLLFCISIQATHSQNNKPKSAANTQLYKDAKQPVDKRIENLLAQMTLEEKLGQMTQLCASSITLDGTKKLDLNLDKIREYITKEHVGSFLSGTGSARRWVSFVKGIQEVAMKETRLGIPIIFGMDHVHGADYVDEGTMLPHNLNLSCTFNTQLARDAAQITAIESADLGHHWNFAPVLDVGKNPYWPRLYETFGEDPLVCSRFGAAFVDAFQNNAEIAPFKLSACAKHFIGYSDPKSGLDRTPSEIPDQVIYEHFVPPFKAAFDAGVKTLMVNSGELNGEPVHISKKYLTNMLRNQLKFEGVILTDIKDILKVVEMHAGARDEREATRRAILAGVDMSMACSSTDFVKIMKDLVATKEVSVARIDESVKRILKLKFELGLFDFPYPTDERLYKIGSDKHRKMAYQSALESIVLLKNEHETLPLPLETKKILIAGLGANSKRQLNGAWTLEWLGAEESRQPKNMETMLTAIQKTYKNSDLIWVDSADVHGSKGFFRFLDESTHADAIVLCLGELPYSEFKGNINDLSLETSQLRLIQAAKLAGKPIILVLLAGRPRVISEVIKDVDAILFAGHPGMEGAPAIVDIISGKENPSGKLSFSYPASVGHFTTYYHKKSDKYQPQFPFGHGLHFGQVVYKNLSISDSMASAQDVVTVRVEITNQGKLPVKETVLWYGNQAYGKLTRPVKQLVDFQKIDLMPGETKTVTFTSSLAKLFTYPDENGSPIFDYETGYIEVEGLRSKIHLKRPKSSGR